MMRTLKYMAALAAVALLAACSSDPTDPIDPAGEIPPLQGSDLPIRWNIKEVAAPTGSTRALIGNDREANDPEGSTDPVSPNYFVPLSEACSTNLTDDPLKEKGFAVGLFGDYSYEENGETVTEYDLYRGTRLVYLTDASEDLPSKWDTNAGMKYWHPGAHYIFRAYYPQRLHGYTVSTSNATTLALVYPTRKLQYDLLLGYAAVEATSEQVKKPVALQLNHALAALRFNFKLGFEDVDWLTSVYLLNDEKRSYFSQGTVIYGTKNHLDSLAWLPDYNPPATEALYKWTPPMKFWKDDVAELERHLQTIDKEEWSKIPGLMKSTLKTPDSGGDNTQTGENAIEYEIMTTAYVNGKEVDENGNTVVNVTETGELYARNSGWLLIVPQKSHGTLSVCFTTKKGGNAVYKVALPKKTGTLIDKEGKVMRDQEGNLITESPDGTDYWVAGMRYIYTITLSRSDYSVDLSIRPWSERKHSTEIIF